MPLKKVLERIPIQDRENLYFLLKNPEFREKPALSYSEFVERILGVKEDVYPKILEEGNKIIKGILEGRYNEGVALWGIGSGKSFLVSTICLWFVHYLLCLKNPHKYYGITNDKPISVVNMGTTASQAQHVVFAGLKTMISRSAWFLNFRPEILQKEIRFQNNVALYSGNSQETMPIGMNILCGVLDEAAWYIDTENHSIAENIYNTMKNRIVSRFGNKGFIFVISAPRYVDDFITKHYEQIKNRDDVYSSTYKTWEVKDPEKMSKETFVFDTGTEKWIVPIDFKQSAELNAEKFMRDFGARPSLVLEPFDKDAIRVLDCIEGENPEVDGILKSDFICNDDEVRYIHVDLGLRHDACGFAMGHLAGIDTSEGEQKAIVKIDYLTRIVAPPNGEIKFSEVRQLIYDLQARKFKIAKVTYDGFQSVDSIQILKSKGIEAEVLSVDKTVVPYDTLKEMIHTKRFICPYYEPFINEYQRLEYVKGKKVDHPSGGSKDVSDAVAGVCYNIASEMGISGRLPNQSEKENTFLGDLLNKNF